jgi:hypothetical protein
MKVKETKKFLVIIPNPDHEQADKILFEFSSFFRENNQSLFFSFPLPLEARQFSCKFRGRWQNSQFRNAVF